MATTFSAAQVNVNNHALTWTLGDADNGKAVECGQLADKTVQISGTFASATIVLQGSNDGSNWFALTDPQGNAIAPTSAILEAVQENPRFIRAISSGGSGTAVTVILFARGTL